MITQPDVQSIQDSVRQGTLVELSETGPCAMSTTAFRRHVLQEPAVEKKSRVAAICAVLSDVLKLNGDAPRTRFDFRFFGTDGRPQTHALKLEWFTPNKCWVVLLPDEQLRTVMQSRGVNTPSHPAEFLAFDS